MAEIINAVLRQRRTDTRSCWTLLFLVSSAAAHLIDLMRIFCHGKLFSGCSPLQRMSRGGEAVVREEVLKYVLVALVHTIRHSLWVDLSREIRNNATGYSQ